MDDSFVNRGEEVILTLLWQSGASESATVCFVISLSICYWLFKCRVLRFVCEWEIERERERARHSAASCVCVCVCVCVCSRACSHACSRAHVRACVREGDTGRFSICVLVCTCVLVDLWNVISRRPSTVPIQSSHLAKYSWNPRMCPCSAPFIKDASEVTCANLRQPGIPECISHQSASVNGRGENRKISKYYSYCVMKCRSKSISGENVVV